MGNKKDETDAKFEEEQFKQREYLAQSLEDLERILKKQSERIYEKIINFSRTNSPWLIGSPLYYSVKLIPFQANFNNAKGYIETPAWLKRRKAIINIKNKNDQCFIKCIYRALNYDSKNKHNSRDISNIQLQEFIKQHNIDLSMFSEGYTPAALSKFEEVNKVGINIYKLSKKGPEKTELKYITIYTAVENFSPMINLGFLKAKVPVEGGVKFITHFVLIQKVHLIFNKAYQMNHNTAIVCPQCVTYISNKEYLPKHYSQYRAGDLRKPQIILPKPDKAFIKYDLNNPKHFKKTEVYPFVCFCDFEATNKVITENGTEIITQVPNSYAIYSPDLLKLPNKHDRVSRDKAYKFYMHEDPEELMKKFVEDLYSLHNIHCNKLQGHPNMKPLTPEQQKKHEKATKCEKCGKEFGSKIPRKKDPSKSNTVIKVQGEEEILRQS
jgi:hypothetical protein